MRPNKPVLLTAAFLAAALLCWRFPLFHMVPLKQAQESQKAATFDAAKVANDFWNTRLLPATESAVELNTLLTALAKDSAAARKQHGRTLGIGGATVFLVSGSGKVAAVEEVAIVVLLDGSEAKASLSTGLLFGNTVRDATGLLDVSAYPNSQDFNALSTQLNAIVEKKVTPALKQAATVGKKIHFVGCIELEEDAKPDAPSVIPIKVDWP